MITTGKLKEITELAESVPEPFRVKCFELLLSHHLSAQEGKDEFKGGSKKETKTDAPPQKFILPIDVKAFLNQYSLGEASVKKLFFIEGNNIRPIYELKVHKKAAAQIQHALLMSLESALISGEFKFSSAGLRQRCKDLKCFDSANFMATLKNNSSYFKDLDDEESICLSTDGKAELADVIEKLINE